MEVQEIGPPLVHQATMRFFLARLSHRLGSQLLLRVLGSRKNDVFRRVTRRGYYVATQISNFACLIGTRGIKTANHGIFVLERFGLLGGHPRFQPTKTRKQQDRSPDYDEQ